MHTMCMEFTYSLFNGANKIGTTDLVRYVYRPRPAFRTAQHVYPHFIGPFYNMYCIYLYMIVMCIIPRIRMAVVVYLCHAKER